MPFSTVNSAFTVSSQKVSIARVTANVLHWMALGWTIFSWSSFVFTFFEFMFTPSLTTAGESGLRLALRHELWGLNWLLPVLSAELVAFCLSRIAGQASAKDVSSKEWLVGFIVSLVPNGFLAIRLLWRLLMFPI
jgi:hypothetical protein